VAIEEGPDDRVPAGKPPKRKPYLPVRSRGTASRRVLYCHTPKAGFKELLIERLGGG
jgi:hypothetical protein